MRYGGTGLALAEGMWRTALIVFDPEHMPSNYGRATELRERLVARLVGEGLHL